MEKLRSQALFFLVVCHLYQDHEVQEAFHEKPGWRPNITDKIKICATGYSFQQHTALNHYKPFETEYQQNDSELDHTYQFFLEWKPPYISKYKLKGNALITTFPEHWKKEITLLLLFFEYVKVKSQINLKHLFREYYHFLQLKTL